MKQTLFLNQYLYSIPTSAEVLPAHTKKSNQRCVEQRPLLKVAFDFEYGRLQLEGDWQFMVSGNKYSKPIWFTYHKDRVFIDAAMYPSDAVNLNDDRSDGLTLPLRGSIDDGAMTGSCSGLLTLDRIRHSHSAQWAINCYLCDLQFPHCEIKFKLPVYITSSNKCSN